jgi:hypothetical protein
VIHVKLHAKSHTKPQMFSGAKEAAYHSVLTGDGSALFLIHESDNVATYTMPFGSILRFIVHLQRKGRSSAGPVRSRPLSIAVPAGPDALQSLMLKLRVCWAIY